MNLKYKIIEVYPEHHSIVVRFYSDAITEQELATQTDEQGKVLRGRTDYAFDLPIPAPTGAALDEFIRARAPSQWLDTMAAVKDPAIDTSLSEAQSLIGVERVSGTAAVAAADPLQIETSANAAALQESIRVTELKALIQQVLADMLAEEV